MSKAPSRFDQDWLRRFRRGPLSSKKRRPEKLSVTKFRDFVGYLDRHDEVLHTLEAHWKSGRLTHEELMWTYRDFLACLRVLMFSLAYRVHRGGTVMEGFGARRISGIAFQRLVEGRPALDEWSGAPQQFLAWFLQPGTFLEELGTYVCAEVIAQRHAGKRLTVAWFRKLCGDVAEEILSPHFGRAPGPVENARTGESVSTEMRLGAHATRLERGQNGDREDRLDVFLESVAETTESVVALVSDGSTGNGALWQLAITASGMARGVTSAETGPGTTPLGDLSTDAMVREFWTGVVDSCAERAGQRLIDWLNAVWRNTLDTLREVTTSPKRTMAVGRLIRYAYCAVRSESVGVELIPVEEEPEPYLASASLERIETAVVDRLARLLAEHGGGSDASAASAGVGGQTQPAGYAARHNVTAANLMGKPHLLLSYLRWAMPRFQECPTTIEDVGITAWQQHCGSSEGSVRDFWHTILQLAMEGQIEHSDAMIMMRLVGYH